MSEGLSTQVQKQLADFEKTLTELELAVQEHLNVPFEDHMKRDAFSMLRVDTMSLFVLNSLATVYESTNGVDPKQNETLQREMNRVKDLVTRTKNQEERITSAPEVNAQGAKAFVRNALFDLTQKKKNLE